MTETTPITQDVLTIPRKLPEGPINLVGLTRDKLRAVLRRVALILVNDVADWEDIGTRKP